MDSAGFAGVIRPSDGQQLFNPIGGAMVVKVRDATTHDGLSVHDNADAAEFARTATASASPP